MLCISFVIQFLPRAYVICGKVMFSLVSVCLFMGGGPPVVEGPVQTCSLGDPPHPDGPVRKRAVGLRPQGKIMYSEASVSHSVQGRGRVGQTPRRQIPWYWQLQWSVRILLENILVTACKRSCWKIMFLHLSVILFTGGCTTPWADTPDEKTPSSPEMATAVDGTHPTGMHSCFVLCLGSSILTFICYMLRINHSGSVLVNYHTTGSSAWCLSANSFIDFPIQLKMSDSRVG